MPPYRFNPECYGCTDGDARTSHMTSMNREASYIDATVYMIVLQKRGWRKSYPYVGQERKYC
jgi:hypothetical protein